jgi:hypothetical protein
VPPREAVLWAPTTTDDAFAWLAQAIGRNLVNQPMLTAALATRKRMRRRPWLVEALADVAGGVMSPIELRYVRDVERAHGLPSAKRQARRELDGGVRYLDNFHEAFRLCVEIDGRLTHPPEQKWRDADRDSADPTAPLTGCALNQTGNERVYLQAVPLLGTCGANFSTLAGKGETHVRHDNGFRSH